MQSNSFRLLYLLAGVAVCLCAASSRGDDAAALVEKLNTATGEELYAVVDDLGDLGPAAKGAVGELTKLLTDEDENVRWHSARALGAIGPDAASAIGALTERLGDDNALVRGHSAFALGLIGEAAKPSAPNLVALVADEDPLVRRSALRALFRIKPDRTITRPLFLKILQSSDAPTVTAVLHSMAEMGEAAVPALSDALDHQDGRYWATLVVQEIGPPAAPLVPKLTEMVSDDDEPEVRMHAVLALGAIGPDAKDAVPAIIEQLKSDELNAVKYAAAYALPKIGAPQAKDALQATVDANKGEEGDLFLRVVAARALAKMFPDDDALQKESVDAFMEGLQSEDADTRRASVRALAESNAPSDVVAPRMVEIIAKSDSQVIGEVIATLSAMGAEAVPRVKNGLKNPDLRGYAAVILANIGPAAKDAVPELTTALDVDDDPDFRREVLFTLGQIGPSAAPATDKIIQVLETDKEERVVSAACYALGSIGPTATKAGPALVGVYNDGTEIQQIIAIWALLKVRPGFESVEKRAIPLLIKALSHEGDHVQLEAAKALGDIGPKAAEAVPELEKILDDDDPAVRAAAKAALGKIQK